MKRSVITACFIIALAVLAAMSAADESVRSPLVGLWEFEKTEVDADFMSYAEYTADGIYVFQLVTGGEVRSLDIDRYTDADGLVEYDEGYPFTYSLEGDTLILTRIAQRPYEAPVVSTWHRMAERPDCLLSVRNRGDYAYTEEGGEATIVKYIAADHPGALGETVAVPDELGGLRVTAMREYAFENMRADTVILPESLTAIPDHAFEDSLFRRIVIPEGIAGIGAWAFADNDALEEIALPESLVRIGENAFANCGLTEIELPGELSVLEGNPFSACPELRRIRVAEENPAFELIDGVLFGREDRRLIWYPMPLNRRDYTVPDGVRIICDSAFWGNQHLESVALPDSVTEIGAFAFDQCTHLETIRLPASVTVIGQYAFSGCWSLQELTVPEGVTEISKGLLYGASELRSVRLPSSLTAIRYGAFTGCDSLSEITIPDGVMEIGSMAFYGCYSLMSVDLPDSLETIGDQAFERCSGLRRIVIPSGVIRIGETAFRSCTGITLVVSAGSFAEQFCLAQGIPHEVAE